MFKEIENELLSILNDDPIEKIAHMPTNEITKTMELLYNIKFEDIDRVYTECLGKIYRMVVIYNSKNKDIIDNDLCPINGKLYYILFLPSSLLNKSETNAIALSRTIISYIVNRINLYTHDNIIECVKDNTFYLVLMQSVPIITCAIMKKIYSGPSLRKLIYMSLSEIKTYKELYTEEGIDTILDLLDEGLGVTELLDSGFICSIPPDDKKYPGIWCGNFRKE